jgi:hypothetical protein
MCPPDVRHVWELKKVISNTKRNVQHVMLCAAYIIWENVAGKLAVNFKFGFQLDTLYFSHLLLQEVPLHTLFLGMSVRTVHAQRNRKQELHIYLNNTDPNTNIIFYISPSGLFFAFKS